MRGSLLHGNRERSRLTSYAGSHREGARAEADDVRSRPVRFARSVRQGKLMQTSGCESRPANVLADRLVSSLAGDAVTDRLKRRQRSYEDWDRATKFANVAEAELILRNEGSTCAVVMRDGVAPPGSKASSRVKGLHRNLGGPAIADLESDAVSEGQPKPAVFGRRKSDRSILSMKSPKATR